MKASSGVMVCSRSPSNDHVPNCSCGLFAKGPITATFVVSAKGSTLSFFNKTVLLIAAFFAASKCASAYKFPV